MKTERKLTKEEYLKLKGLRAMHDDLERQRENIWSSAEKILEKVISEESTNKISTYKEFAVDSMHWKNGLDKYLEEKEIEVEENEV